MKQLPVTKCRNTEFHWGERTYIMGIINTSPESFSGDGLKQREAVLQQALRFIEEGADILDIGGESTKPGLEPVSLEEEIQRVLPVLEYLEDRISVPISIDTTKPEVAALALEAGASILNDQWGLRKEPELAELAAEKGVPIILMSNQRDKGGFDSGAGRDTADYADVMAEVISALREGIEVAHKAGVPPENVIVDPGIGFGKTWQQDLELVKRLAELKELGKPILLGTSRKSLIKMVMKTPAADRVEGTAATVSIGIAGGADIVRVHDVKAMARVARMTDAIIRGVKEE